MSRSSLCGLFLMVIGAPGCFDFGWGGGPHADAQPVSPPRTPTAPPDSLRRLIVLHTNDLHDHLMGLAPETDYTPASINDDATAGGFARLAAAIADLRAFAGNTPVLLLDAGDFSQGTLFSWLSPSDAPTLTLMRQVGYDATTVGNHELDWGLEPFADMLMAAQQHGGAVPVLAANLTFPCVWPGQPGRAAAMAVVKDLLVKTLPGGLKVGLFGLIGQQAASDILPNVPVTVEDPIVAAKRTVQVLKHQHHVDVIICLSHSGVDAAGQGEDASLAAAVPEINLIISGHDHVALQSPITVGSTIIAQAGDHGRWLGVVGLGVRPDGQVVPEIGTLYAISDDIRGDATVQAAVDGYITKLDALLAPMGLAYRKAIARTAFDLPRPRYAESSLGDLIADAYLARLTALDPAHPPLLAFEANGLIPAEVRAGKSGKLWFADLYRTLPQGAGLDGQPGYPLTAFYLSGAEIKAGLELIASAQDVLQNDDYFLQIAGVKVRYDPQRPPFDRVTSVVTAGGAALDLTDTSSCYKVATNLYIAAMLPMLAMATGGAVDVEPKAKGCTRALPDLTAAIVDGDPGADGVQELKPWAVVIEHLAQLPDLDGDGLPDVPAAYAQPQGRISLEQP
jgi:5'-nucleotidase / UDP-sugar diphosphatase